jgi:kynurenine formamidase
VDLGHPLSESDPTWTGEKVFSRTVVATAEKDGYAAGRFTTEEHFGTHLDAPAHFGGAWTVDKIPVERLVWRPGVCISIETQSRTNEDYRLTLADVKAFERAHGPIPERAIVFVATGWDRFWSDPARYRNERQGVKHFPGLSVEAAEYLAKTRRVVGIGIDTLSVDYGPSSVFEVHKTTMPLNLYHIENAADLTTLPPTGFTVTVAPIDLAGGSGGPTRVFARLP